MTSDDTAGLDGDLWSVPPSARPADDLVEVPGLARRRRVPRKGISLVIAVALLVGLGFAAQQLDPARGTATSSQGNQAPPGSVPASGSATVITGGPSYCPMQAKSVGLDCFFVG